MSTHDCNQVLVLLPVLQYIAYCAKQHEGICAVVQLHRHCRWDCESDRMHPLLASDGSLNAGDKQAVSLYPADDERGQAKYGDLKLLALY